MNKRQERSIFFAILCCCCLTIIVILLISIPAGYYIYETYFICLGDPPTTPGLLADWDGQKRYSGLVVKYRCNMENSHEVVQIVDCVGGEWKIVMKKTGLCAPAKPGDEVVEAHPLVCQDDPPQLPGMTRIWDGVTRSIGSTVEYRCQKDPEQDRAIIMVCTEFVWKTTYKKSESCDDLMQIRRCLGDPWPSVNPVPSDWDNKSRDVGTQIRFFCNESPNSPVMRIMMCSRDYHWHMIADTKESCYCGHPIYYPQPIQYNWDGKSLIAGSNVKYWCNTALGKINFMTIQCSKSANWIVTERGTCSFLVDRPLNFTDAVNYCNHLDSEMAVPHNDSDLEQLKSMLKEEKSFDLGCNHKAFIGLRENVGKQWSADTDGPEEYVSTLSGMWATLDEGREHCAAMQQSAKWQLNNVLCNGGIRYCAVCEVNSTNPSPMKICPEFQKTCFLAISAHKGDYANEKNVCESIGGKIAAPTSLRVMGELIKAVKADPAYENECQWAYVGLVNNKRHYETLEDNEVEYGPFVHDRVRSMSRHCVVIHEKNHFKYVDEHCPLNTCFMCTIKGPPIGTSVLAHVNKQSLLNEQGIEARIRPRGMTPVVCKPGWTTDGIGCFLFNETHVTESEARATCRRQMSDLASLTIPIDRQFISHYLIRHFSGTDSLLWYVEMSGGLEDEYESEEIEVDLDTNCTIVHLLPHFGWSFMDCTTKAAFICHD